MTKTIQCPECGAEASGNFCASCGTALGKRFCTQCGAQATPGARFCTSCGASFATGGPPPMPGESRSPGGSRPRPTSSGSGGGSNTAWWVAGAMMVVVMVFMLQPILSPESAAPPAAPGNPAAAGGGATTDISSMTPRQAADALYNRVMTALEANDSGQVQMFLPMALQSYDMARPLDLDGLFHLARLQRVGVLDEESLATAEEALARNPDYLLALYAAGDAALALGREDVATQYLGRLIEVWESQMGSGNQDYELHASQMPGILEFAREAVGGG